MARSTNIDKYTQLAEEAFDIFRESRVDLMSSAVRIGKLARALKMQDENARIHESLPGGIRQVGYDVDKKLKHLKVIEQLFCRLFYVEETKSPMKYVPYGALEYVLARTFPLGDPNQNGQNLVGAPILNMYNLSEAIRTLWIDMDLCSKIEIKELAYLQISRNGRDLIDKYFPAHSKFYLALRDIVQHKGTVAGAAIGLAASIIGVYEFILKAFF